jgi:hypothetical protein
MKRGIVVSSIGLMIVIINILVGLVDPAYDVFNNILVNFSILSSTVMFFMIFSHTKIHTFPFALVLIFGMSGLVKLAFSAFSDNHWRDNLLVFLIMVITLVEATIIMFIYGFWRTRKNANGHSDTEHP